MKTTGTDPDIDILFEDNHLLAVQKPAGLLSQEDYTGEPDLLNLCKKYLIKEYNKKGNAYLGLLHRLDKPVSGVMLLAKTSKAASRVNEQIRKRSFKKSYLTIVEGTPPINGMLLDYLIKDKKTNTVHISSSKNKKAQKAELFYQLEAAKKNLSLLKISLITGRPHQIRVQLANFGYPILNDKKYGSKNNGSLALHASGVIFNHPTLHKTIEIYSKPILKPPWNTFEEEMNL